MAKELKSAQGLNLLLRTMRKVVEEDHGIPLPKKSFCRPFSSWSAKKAEPNAQLPVLWREPPGPLPAAPAPGRRSPARRVGSGAGAPCARNSRAWARENCCTKSRPTYAYRASLVGAMPCSRCCASTGCWCSASAAKTTASHHHLHKRSNLVKEAPKSMAPNRL